MNENKNCVAVISHSTLLIHSRHLVPNDVSLSLSYFRLMETFQTSSVTLPTKPGTQQKQEEFPFIGQHAFQAPNLHVIIVHGQAATRALAVCLISNAMGGHTQERDHSHVNFVVLNLALRETLIVIPNVSINLWQHLKMKPDIS